MATNLCKTYHDQIIYWRNLAEIPYRVEM